MRLTALPCLGMCLFLWLGAHAQAKREGEAKIRLSEIEEMPRLLPAGENGLVLYRKLIADEKSGIGSWEIEFYDSKLKRVWNTIFSADIDLSITRHAWFRDDFYFLFEGIKNLKRIVQVVRMNTKDRSFTIYPINSFTPSAIMKFDILGNTIVLGGTEKLKPSVVLYKFNDHRPVILQGLYSNKIDLVGIDVDNANELVSVVTSFRNPMGKYCIGVRSYDRDGHDIENIVIEPPDGILLSQGATCIIRHQYRVVSGIFRNIDDPRGDGLYVSRININGEQRTKYYDFSTLFGYSSSADSIRKNPQNFLSGPLGKLSWIAGDITVMGNEPVILVEGFDVEEQGSPGLNPRAQIAYAFQKGLAVILKEDTDTIKSIEMNMEGHRLENLDKNLFFIPSNSGPRIAYFDVTRLGLFNLDEAESSADRYFISLPDLTGTNSENNAYQHRYSSFRHWFGKSYLYSGIITNKDENGENTRTMFVEKIVFD